MGTIQNSILCSLALLASNAIFAYSDKIDPELRRTLERKGHANVLVSMKAGTKDILNNLSRITFSSRTERSQAVYNALTSRAHNSQSQILSFLAVPNTINTFKFRKVQSLWISNQIGIQVANLDLIELLASMDEISRIQEDEIQHLIDPIEGEITNLNSTSPVYQWGIQKIEAPEAWSMFGGNYGSGITVSNIDTGVRYTHEILRNNYKNDGHSWYDPYFKSAIPSDKNGHGTHTMGIIVGENGFGVAPAAKWIACKGMQDDGYGRSTMLIACGQYIICPTRPSGTNADCSKTPHIVNNSWGSNGSDTFYDNVIAAWHAAGIVPVFSNGNSGPKCGSGVSPADRDIIAVGSTTATDSLSRFSSVGPSLSNTIKPDISAPGSFVTSASYQSDYTYRTMSGTSMASPHVSGVVALMFNRNTNLSYKQIKTLLELNADRNLTFSDSSCGGISDNVFPNNHFGYGRLNAYKALQALY